MRIETFTGTDFGRHLDALARLRIEVFRDFPYLYDGDPDYERDYLQTYIDAPDSLIVVVFDGETIVGASTALPMRYETDEFKQPFLAKGYAIDRIFYCGESVLQKPYRGKGLGVRFFAEREAHAHRLGGFDWCCFCAVERAPDHPRRPHDYTPLDAFWKNRGYSKHTGLQTQYSWRDLDELQESAKTMTFWMKRLNHE